MVKVQQRGLGKGLSALISENYTQNPVTQGEGEVPAAPSELKLTQVVPGKFQPRTRFHEEQLKELAASIKKNGVMQPIVVRAVQRDGRPVYEIIAGERRWRAATQAGLQTIPAIVREIGDQQALELALIENVQRADLSPLEEAQGYQRLLEEFSYTQEELGVAVGKSRSHIANLLRLLALPEDIRALLDEGKLSMGHARALLTAKEPSRIAQMTVERGLSVRQVESLARDSHGLSAAARPRMPRSGGRSASLQQISDTVDVLTRPNTGPKDPDIVALESTLTESLGMCVTINDRGQSGDIVVSYESLSQLDDILRRLGNGGM